MVSEKETQRELGWITEPGWALSRRRRPLGFLVIQVHFSIFGPSRDEVTGEWRRLHKEELNDLYSSPNIVRVIKSRRMRWVEHVARMGEERGAYRVLVGKPEDIYIYI